MRLMRLVLLLLVFFGLLRFCVDWEAHERWRAKELAERHADLDTLCHRLLECDACTYRREGERSVDLSTVERWALTGCGSTRPLEAWCGGFGKHTCTWYDGGLQVLTHPD